MSRNFRDLRIGAAAFFIIVAAALSCVPECEMENAPAGPEGMEEYRFTVKVVSPESQVPGGKSSFTEESVSKITDLNVFVYHQGHLLKDCCRYFTDMNSLMLSFPYGVDGFNIYMVGNVGKMEAPEDEASVSDVRYVAASYSDFLQSGFPVAEVFVDYRKGEPAHFELKRLVGQYNVKLKVSAENARYVIKDVRLRNCALDVCPFAGGYGASVFDCVCGDDECACGDRLTSMDITRLKLGIPVPLYFVENVQGVLLPYNDDPKLKIPSSLDTEAASRCTYMEITADVITLGARYNDAKFRFYLGCDQTSDFSILRNTLYDVTLDFTQNMVNEEEWRIETGPPAVSGMKMSKSEAMVIKGAEDMVFLQAFANNGSLLDFDVVYDSRFVNVQKVHTTYMEQESSGAAIGLRITSNVELCGLYPYDSEPDYRTTTVMLYSKETYNGVPLYQASVDVRVYDKLFPLLINIGKVDAGGYGVVLKGRNPMHLGLSLSASYTCAGNSRSIAEKAVVPYIDDSGMLVDAAVDIAGQNMGDFDASMTPSGLSRVDFNIKGVGGTGRPYPRLCASEPVYPGAGNQAWFGPGAGMYPAAYPDLADDGYVSLSYRDYGYELGYTNTQWGGWTSDDDMSSSYTSEQTPPFDADGGFRRFDYKAQGDGKVYFEFSDSMGVHVPSVGEYRHGGHGFQSENSQAYSACPFYFVNAGLTLFYTYASWNYDQVKYPKKSNNGFTFKLYGSGRDLFAENRNGTLLNNVHEMGFWVARWKNLVGKTKTQQATQSYSGQLYMTVNGASAWTGCDTSEFGYFPE